MYFLSCVEIKTIIIIIQYTKKVKNIPEVDHVKPARVWADVDKHQLQPRHK